MTEKKTEDAKGGSEGQADPFGPMIEFYDSWSRSWAKAMSEAVASQSFVETMGQQMEGSMEALQVVRRQVSEMMEQYLQQMSLPTRAEVVSLAERLTKIEMLADDIDAKLDEVLDLLKSRE